MNCMDEWIAAENSVRVIDGLVRSGKQKMFYRFIIRLRFEHTLFSSPKAVELLKDFLQD